MGFTEIEIADYDFQEGLKSEILQNHLIRDYWPVVYILSNGDTKTAYVGETADALNRMLTHLKHKEKSKLTTVHLITSDTFNKSATLDIEANLIRYMSGDNNYTLLNGNLGLANHTYYQKTEYWNTFNSIWDKLMAKGISTHSLEHINNSDLFKYSPYKSLTTEQKEGLINILHGLISNTNNRIIVEGGAGTGKTILAIFLFKMLSERLDDFNFREISLDDRGLISLVNEIKGQKAKLNMALVVPMASFRSTLKKVFKHIKGLKPSMVIGPADVSKNPGKYDLLIVDESHRLRRRVNLGAYFGAFDQAAARMGFDKTKTNELEWVLAKSDKTILFYDEGQSIKPSDVEKEAFDSLKNHESSIVLPLKSQFRVRGGNGYVEFIDKLLNVRLDSEEQFHSDEYEFILFDSLEDMVHEIKAREKESGLARLIAGYSWQWKSKNTKKEDGVYDIEIDGMQLRWNSTSNDWINSEDAQEEVGCIHTTQGYDLNYAGIIFGNEISYDPKTDQIVIKEEHYFDRYGKQSVKDPEELKNFILNIYKTIMLRGIKGTYVYACDAELRAYLKKFIPGSSQELDTFNPILEKEIEPFVNSVPLYDLKVAAGEFGEMQRVEEMTWIRLPKHIQPSKDLFACQVVGESMNKIIPDGSYCLFRKYSGGSRNGRIVLVESTHINDRDFGSCYTVKEYESTKQMGADGWRHDAIILKPRSFNSKYQNIVLEEEEMATFKVIGLFVCVVE